MRKVFIIFVCVFCAGCMAINAEPEGFKSVVLKSTEFTHIAQIKNGMSKETVFDIMGSKVVIGYKESETFENTFEPIVVTNPHRSEVLKGKNKVYDVVYYFTSVKNSDGKVSDDELTPLVFQGDRFVGKGWKYLSKLKRKISKK
ncbi:MAG: DUF3192 domain-containing protein [Candidatus Zapsychrus exili]|nr:DUF3192 domain-containing protein [Candidatus Zapsychrus exili]